MFSPSLTLLLILFYFARHAWHPGKRPSEQFERSLFFCSLFNLKKKRVSLLKSVLCYL